MSQKRAGLVERARKEDRRTNVIGFVDEELLHRAFRSLRTDAAAGIDGQTWEAYQMRADATSAELSGRRRSGQYRAPAIRRVWIPQDEGGRRPLGITTIEDRIVQKAVAWVVSAVYEQDFLDCSSGYRPGRSTHTALHQRHRGLDRAGARVVVHLDSRGSVDRVNREWLRRVLRHRVNDGGVLRLMGKWLQAGVLDQGVVTRSETGVPQGGPVSPVRSNVSRHDVLDLWFDRRCAQTCRGDAQLVRYADDGVAIFARSEDAERVRRAVEARLAAVGLELSAEKTALIPCGDERGPGPKPGTVTVLGFVHDVGRTRTGKRKIGRKPSGQTRERFLRRIALWLRLHRHEPVRTQRRSLSRARRGYDQYVGIRDSSRALSTVRYRTERLWWHALRRRSQRATRTTQWATIRRQPWFQLPPPRLTNTWV